MSFFAGDCQPGGVKAGAHPAEPVSFYLGSNNTSNNELRMKQLELWFCEYQTKRGHQYTIYKPAADVVRGLPNLKWRVADN